MNEILRSLKTRKSVRVFTEEPVSPEVERQLLTAAMEAPTAGNQQLYTILKITDPQLKKALSVTCDNQPFIATAPLVLVFCADCKKWYEAYLEAGCTPRKPGVGDLMLAVSDTNIAAQNVVVAAESLGLGSCYIGDIIENCEEQRRLLQLPEYVFPCTMLVIGYPTQQQKQRKKPERCRLEHIVYENTYPEMTGALAREMLSHKAQQRSFEDWCAAFCNRKYNSAFSEEMTRSVGEYLKQFTMTGKEN